MRALKAAVVGLGVLCLGAFGFLVWLVVKGAGGKPVPAVPAVAAPAPVPAAAPAGSWGTLDLGLPAGSRIEAIAATATALSIHVRLPDGSARIVVVDPGSGTELGRIVPGDR